MTSPLLALFTRSLREDTRSKATYAARAGLAGFVLVVLLGIAAFAARTQGAPGLMFFGSVISLQIVAITLVGLSHFASAITEEKEEETLGLLRMTNLNPLSILLGKSTSRLCGALLLLITLLPFTLLAITLGGVSLGQILASYCTLGAYTFFLCNLALLWSVIAPTTARAALGTIATLVVFFAGGLLLEGVQMMLNLRGWLDDGSLADGRMKAVSGMWRAGTPIARLTEILATGFSDTAAGWQVWSNLALGVGCFFTAWAAFTRYADRAADGATASSARRRFLGVRFRRPPRPWKNALAWKDFHFIGGGVPGFVLRVTFYGGLGIWVIVSALRSAGTSVFIARAFYSSAMALCFTLELAVIASRVFRTELSGQTWSGLALLPLTVRQVAWRKLLGGLLCLVPSAVAMLLASGLALLTGNGFPGLPPATLALSTVSGWVTTIFIAHLIAFLSLLMKRGALALGFVITYAVTIVIQIGAMALLFASNFGSSRGAAFSSSRMLIGPVVTAAVCLVAIFFLQRGILRRLETLAAES